LTAPVIEQNSPTLGGCCWSAAVLLEAADKLTTDAEALARGWETHLTLVTEALVPTEALFPLVDRLADKANTQLSIITEVLAGAGSVWRRAGRISSLRRTCTSVPRRKSTPASSTA
jgi:hypothetical protein